MAALDHVKVHHHLPPATSLLPDLHAGACMPCSDELNDASEQPDLLQTLSPASCSGRSACMPASASGDAPLTSRVRGGPSSKCVSIDFESTVGQPGTGAPLSQSIIPEAEHKQQDRAVQAFWPGGLDSAAVASTAAVGAVAMSAAVSPTPSGGGTRAALPRGGPSRQPGPQETAVRVVCHIRYSTPQQVRLTHHLKALLQASCWLLLCATAQFAQLRPGMGLPAAVLCSASTRCVRAPASALPQAQGVG